MCMISFEYKLFIAVESARYPYSMIVLQPTAIYKILTQDCPRRCSYPRPRYRVHLRSSMSIPYFSPWKVLDISNDRPAAMDTYKLLTYDCPKSCSYPMPRYRVHLRSSMSSFQVSQLGLRIFGILHVNSKLLESFGTSLVRLRTPAPLPVHFSRRVN
jgi:hypothetical protein